MLFVLDRAAAVEELDGARIARAIGLTRFPYSSLTDEEEVDEKGTLTGADLIGQLGDPHYLRKANALYYEFEEIGLNKQLGYESPATSSINIRNSIGTESLRTSAARCVAEVLEWLA